MARKDRDRKMPLDLSPFAPNGTCEVQRQTNSDLAEECVCVCVWGGVRACVRARVFCLFVSYLKCIVCFVSVTYIRYYRHKNTQTSKIYNALRQQQQQQQNYNNNTQNKQAKRLVSSICFRLTLPRAAHLRQTFLSNEQRLAHCKGQR